MSIRALMLAGLLWGVITPFLQAEEIVQLVKGEHSIKVLIGDDVFTVFEFGKKYAKPYFLPVTAPGAFAALEQNLKREIPEGSPGRQVLVCGERAALEDAGEVTGWASYGDVLTVEEAKHVMSGSRPGHWLRLAGKTQWIHRQDVAPLAGTVTRLINDNPSPTRDRNAPEYYDHPHHKGLWNSIDEVNHVQFWAEKGRIENQNVELLTRVGSPAKFRYVNHWLGEDGQPVVVETTTVEVFPHRLIRFAITFTAGAQPATFRDTKEGMFAIRLPNSMREFTSNGPVIGADGGEGTKALWGKPNRWIDYCGQIEGRMFGVTLMDHPGNPRESRYHVRDYGLFSLSPFGQKSYSNNALPEEPLTLEPGGAGATFRYGMFVHDGPTDRSQVEQAFETFAQ